MATGVKRVATGALGGIGRGVCVLEQTVQRNITNQRPRTMALFRIFYLTFTGFPSCVTLIYRDIGRVKMALVPNGALN